MSFPDASMDFFAGYRVRPDDPYCEEVKRNVPDYENLSEMTDYSDTISSCTSEMSVALSTESTLTLTEKETTPTPVNGTLTRTPILRRRRCNGQGNPRRNYRIMAPDESIMILKQQSGLIDTQQPSPRSKILRRKSSRKEKDIISSIKVNGGGVVAGGALHTCMVTGSNPGSN
nr:unnamed protein product [Haemonchus contortus]